MHHLKLNIVHGLKALHNLGVDLRVYGEQVENKVQFEEPVQGLHEAIMNACEEMAEGGEGKDALAVLWYYIDKATAM